MATIVLRVRLLGGEHTDLTYEDPRQVDEDAMVEQIIEVLSAVGWYRTICTFCNSLALDPEPWMREWPAS